jgi:hypothetical protein
LKNVITSFGIQLIYCIYPVVEYFICAEKEEVDDTFLWPVEQSFKTY